MKRYLVFAGYNYYPGGGFWDLRGMFDTLNEASKHMKKCKQDGRKWGQIVDTETEKIMGGDMGDRWEWHDIITEITT